MQFIKIDKNNWSKYRTSILQFVKCHGEFEHTSESYAWLFQLKKDDLDEPGTILHIVLWDGKIIAIAALEQYGLQFSIFIVSPQYRKTDVIIMLYKEISSRVGVYYTKIDYKDIDKIMMALKAGLVSFTYEKTTTGQIALWFGSGHWHSSDIDEKEVL
ncbi:hypothetical protein ACJ2A9_07140 [Anaerobacillus sp. MEB173]|uniref:hypothetical protein n=1 Tax=Anaerobacillus sp. MEB173 TaxID=3383345 RepID=UPI003F90060F